MRITQAHKTAYQSLKHIIVASSYMRDLLAQNGFNPGCISILPPHFEESYPLVAPQRDPLLVLFAGRLEIEKGLPYLLQAVARVQTLCQLLVAGDGTRRTEYETLARKLGIADRVVFAGWLDNAGLHQAYQRASLLVMPGVWPEPFGKVGIEAMAHGRPVVAFNVGGIPDWLQDGYNGFLVPPRDEKQLAVRIEQLLRDVELAMQLGLNGRGYVAEHYSPQQHLGQLLQIFDTAVYSNQ
jgi:glycosyltransferase involved in cell wall biosynthesis